MTATAEATDLDVWHARLDENPEDDQLRLFFSDWWRDQGRDDLADGYAALGRLPVRVAMHLHNGLNAHSPEVENDKNFTRSMRILGAHCFVTDAWYMAMDDIVDAHGVLNLSKCSDISRSQVEEWAALAYATLTAKQREHAERLLKLEGKG